MTPKNTQKWHSKGFTLNRQKYYKILHFLEFAAGEKIINHLEENKIMEVKNR